jgi:hypothetical protein
MATLKNDLDEYMLMNEERKSNSYKLNIKMPKMPSVFGGTSENTKTNSWLNDDDR